MHMHVHVHVCYWNRIRYRLFSKKVFHFKSGGLNDLIQLFRSWKFFNHQCHKESHQHTFTIFRPKLSLSELHPEEGSMQSVLTEDMWRSLMDQAGRIMDSRYVLRVGGVM